MGRFCTTRQLICIFIYFCFFIPTTAAQAARDSIEYEGYFRPFEIYLPAGFHPGMPAVFIFHGYPQDAAFIRDYTGMNEIAEAEGFLAVYPESIPPGWNVEYNHPDLPLPDADDTGFILKMIDILAARYDIDLHRVYCCGFSNGGDMALRLALFLPKRFAAVAAVSGVLTEKTVERFQASDAACGESKSSIPVLMIHGTADTWVPYDTSSYNCLSVEETLRFWLDHNGCMGEPETVLFPDINYSDKSRVEKRVWRNYTGDAAVVFYKIIGGGHGWPGAMGRRSASRQYGAVNMDIDAGRVIWDFFKKY